MASGSSTPTSAGSYTERELVAKLGVAADSSDYFKVKEINALLLTKGGESPRLDGPEMQASRPRLHGRRGTGLPRGEGSGGTGRGVRDGVEIASQGS